MTADGRFSDEEWAGLVQLPRWVVAAASAAQPDAAHRTRVEVEAGLIASAHGRNEGSAFVTSVAEATLGIFDRPGVAGAVEFGDPAAGIASVLERVATTTALLDARVPASDAAAYRRWLLAITDVVIAAVRSGDFLGFGGQRITPAEQEFRDRLAAVLG